MRKILYSLLAPLLLFCVVPAYASFSDVPLGHTNHAAITTLQADGVLQGYVDGSFRPNNTITRAEFVKIIVAGRYPYDAVLTCDLAQPAKLTDIDRTSWYAPYLCIAIQEGLINGYPDHTFRATASMNVSEAAAVLARASREGLDRRTDDLWYTPYVRWLDTHNAIPLSVTRPFDLLRRADMAEMYYRIKHDDRSQPSRVAAELEETGTMPINYLGLTFMMGQEAGNTIVYFGYRELLLGKIQLAEEVEKAIYTLQVKDGDTGQPVVFGVYLQVENKEVRARAVIYDETTRSLRPLAFLQKDGAKSFSVRADGVRLNLGEFSTSVDDVSTTWKVRNGMLLAQ